MSEPGAAGNPALLLVYRSDTGYKNDVSGKKAEEGTVFDELFDPEGLRVAYITIAARTRRDTDAHAHAYTRLADSVSFRA